MDVGINPVAQELDVTKLVLPSGPSIGLKSWDIRWADITGRVSPLRLTKTSHPLGDEDGLFLLPRRSKL